jgi:hypothetical protein
MSENKNNINIRSLNAGLSILYMSTSTSLLKGGTFN